MRDADCVAFLQWALPRLDLRWQGFRKVHGQVCKRLKRRIKALGLADIAAYRARLEAYPDEWATLDEMCHITISRFFRDSRIFETLAYASCRRLPRGLREKIVRCGSGRPAAPREKSRIR